MKQSYKGFTLVELLVVIGIIALLISILLPTLGQARAQAYTVRCMSNLRQIHTYMLMYQNENHGWCLPANNNDNNWEMGDWSGIIARLYFNVKGVDKNGNFLKRAAAFNEIEKSKFAPFLSCPANDRPPYDPTIELGKDGFSASPIKWMYTYNRGFGDLYKLNEIGTPSPEQVVQYRMKKVTEVPGSVFVIADMSAWLPNGRGAQTNRFVTFIREVDPLDSSFLTKGGYVSSPHGIKKKINSKSPGPNTYVNVLLLDGQVVTCAQWKFDDVPNKYLVDPRDWVRDWPAKKIGKSTQHTLN